MPGIDQSQCRRSRCRGSETGGHQPGQRVSIRSYRHKVIITYSGSVSTWEYPPNWRSAHNINKSDMMIDNDNDGGYSDLRGLSPWLRAARVKRTAERASLMVRVTREELSVRVLCPDISSVCTVQSFIRSLTRHHSRLSLSKLSNCQFYLTNPKVHPSPLKRKPEYL